MFSIGFPHAEEGEVDVALGVVTTVRGPQTGNRLATAAYGIFHCATADGSAGGVGVAGLVGKNWEEGNLVGELL